MGDSLQSVGLLVRTFAYLLQVKGGWGCVAGGCAQAFDAEGCSYFMRFEPAKIYWGDALELMRHMRPWDIDAYFKKGICWVTIMFAPMSPP